MNRLLRITSVLGAVLALSACVGPGYGPRYGGGGYHNYANSQPAYRGGWGGGGGGGNWGGRGGWR